MTTYKVIGTQVPRPELNGKATGDAQYTGDVQLPGMLWGKILRSPFSHARIVSIDTSKAEALPGVHVVLTGDDVKGIRFGRGYRDAPVLAPGRVRFVGDRVAAVAAESTAIAQDAVNLIDVQYEELPAVFDPLEALQPDAPVIHPELNEYIGLPKPVDPPSNAFAVDLVERGEVEAGFASADVIVENTFTVSRVHQAYIEPHSCVAWLDDSGKMQLWAPNKNPHGLGQTVARALGIESDQINVNPVVVGGDFGGKGAAMEEPLCCFLAMKAKRPVRLAMSYTDEFTAGAPRHGGVMTLKTGVMSDGTIVAHQMDAAFDSGGYGGFRPGASLGGALHGAASYRIPNVRMEVKRVYTNNLPGGQMRAPAEPQGFFAAESHMDRVAREVAMDPLDFRRKNLIVDGEPTADGHHFQDIRVKETLEAAVKAAGYSDPKPVNVGRGIAIGYRGPGTGESSISVAMRPDGTVLVSTPVFEPGTGTYTTLRLVIAEVLSISTERIEIVVVPTDQSTFDSGIGGSRGTRITTTSAHDAATQVRDELLDLAASLLEWPRDEISIDGDDLVRQSTGDRRRWGDVLTEADRSVTADVKRDSTDRAPMTAFTAQVAEVSVDPETGQVKLLRMTSAHDVGTIINPIGHQGQIYGAVVQGVGYGLIEEIRVKGGRVETSNFGDVKIPTCEDIPEMQTVLLEPAQGAGPFNVKGIGENANTPVAAAIANAVEDAIGIRIRDLPITAEKVYDALQAAKS
jgi:CO/xanthine dehydrogenase Mo-binding subunit